MLGQVISSSLWFGVFICLGLWILELLAGTTLVPFHIVASRQSGIPAEPKPGDWGLFHPTV
jgi:hypothetical protein